MAPSLGSLWRPRVSLTRSGCTRTVHAHPSVTRLLLQLILSLDLATSRTGATRAGFGLIQGSNAVDRRISGRRSTVKGQRSGRSIFTHIAVAFSRYRCVVISAKVLLLVGVAQAGVAYRLAYSAGSTLLQNLIPVNFGPASTAYHGAKQQVTKSTVRSILSLLCSPRASSFAGTAAPCVTVLCIQC